ncbi:MAG: hypothetical protein ACOC22_00665 [bacterium]
MSVKQDIIELYRSGLLAPPEDVFGDQVPEEFIEELYEEGFFDWLPDWKPKAVWHRELKELRRKLITLRKSNKLYNKKIKRENAKVGWEHMRKNWDYYGPIFQEAVRKSWETRKKKLAAGYKQPYKSTQRKREAARRNIQNYWNSNTPQVKAHREWQREHCRKLGKSRKGKKSEEKKDDKKEKFS